VRPSGMIGAHRCAGVVSVPTIGVTEDEEVMG